MSQGIAYFDANWRITIIVTLKPLSSGARAVSLSAHRKPQRESIIDTHNNAPIWPGIYCVTFYIRFVLRVGFAKSSFYP